MLMRSRGRGAVAALIGVAAASPFFSGCRERTPVSPPAQVTAPEASAQIRPVRRDELTGSRTCAECHADQFESYLRTAHSRSLSEVDPAAEPPDAEFRHAPSGRSYQIYRQEGRLRHREWIASEDGQQVLSDDHALRYLIGSGRHSRSYLVEADGFLVESPVTWYASRKAWDMSPGYDRNGHWGFERAADMGCLACHVGSAEAIDQSYHRIALHELSIGCERCHGAGADHVAHHRRASARGAGETDPVVHPGRLGRALSEAICAQCHLRGDATVFLPGLGPMDFRPGQPLASVRLDYRPQRPGGQMKVVGHMEQMWLSRCYTQSDGLSCITCHEMHAGAELPDDADFYRSKCLDCHRIDDCGLPAADERRTSRRDDCVACHMPQTDTDIPHIAFTHHRIGVHVTDSGAPPATDTPLELAPIGDIAELVPGLQDRCLALAYLEFSERQSDPRRRQACQQQAMLLMDRARRLGPLDADLLAALARLHWERRPELAVEPARQALEHGPLTPGSRVNAHFVIGDALVRMGRPQDALGALEELTRLRRNSEDWLLLAQCRQQLRRPDALVALEQALRISPFRPELREARTQFARPSGSDARSGRGP